MLMWHHDWRYHVSPCQRYCKLISGSVWLLRHLNMKRLQSSQYDHPFLCKTYCISSLTWRDGEGGGKPIMMMTEECWTNCFTQGSRRKSGEEGGSEQMSKVKVCWSKNKKRQEEKSLVNWQICLERSIKICSFLSLILFQRLKAPFIKSCLDWDRLSLLRFDCQTYIQSRFI